MHSSSIFVPKSFIFVSSDDSLANDAMKLVALELFPRILSSPNCDSGRTGGTELRLDLAREQAVNPA